MTSLNGSFQGLIPKEPKILARPPESGKSSRLVRKHLCKADTACPYN